MRMKEEIEVVLVEYKALREEVIKTMESRNAILRFGLVVLGTLFAAGGFAGSRGGDYPALSGVLLICVIPCVAVCTLRLWVGEYGRMQRAGAFLGILEAKINTMAGAEPLLVWETYLSAAGKHMRYPYSTVVFLLLFISLFSVVAGIVVVSPSMIPLKISVVPGVLVCACSFTFAGEARRRIRHYRENVHLVRPEEIEYRRLAADGNSTDRIV